MVAATVVAVAAATLTACSNGDDSASAEFNDADVTFAQEMIPHHRQATEMAAMAESRTVDPAVLDLADRIEAAQDPEIETMTDWLVAWDREVPEGDMAGMTGMAGMMDDDQMAELEGASGAEFDRLFLTMMTEHHDGAVEMAKVEQTDGKYEEAVTLAEDIEQQQTAEITQMQDLLGS